MTTTIAMTSSDHTLMLRTCTRQSDGRLTSYDGFEWPALGPVECPDADPLYPLRHWDPTPKCGNGLHGFLRGCGDGGLASWGEDAVWMVVEVLASDVVCLDGKVKVPRGRVLHAGKREDALALMRNLGHLDDGHIGGTATAGDGGTATAGNGGTIIIAWWDTKSERMRKAIGYIGEDGLEAGKKYSLQDAKFVEVK